MKLNILVVEFDLDIRHLLVGILRSFGHSVDSAPTGEQALRLVGIKGEGYDLIISDLRMGKNMSGLDFVRVVRSVAERPKIWICTGAPNQELTHDMKRLEISQILSKPFPSLVDLADKLEREFAGEAVIA